MNILSAKFVVLQFDLRIKHEESRLSYRLFPLRPTLLERTKLQSWVTYTFIFIWNFNNLPFLRDFCYNCM